MQTKLHLIGNAHLDPVWLWTWQEGFMEAIATFRSALDRLHESGDVVFTCSSAQYYKWIEEHDPAMFAEIQRRVAEGRWVIVGGWWIQPDDNMPSGESFARQGLYSQRYYMEKFGRLCKTGYCVDTFGHSAELPKLLRQARMENFVFMRPGDSENPDIPHLFWWRAADGSTVLAFRLLNGYCGDPDADHMERILRESQALGCDLMYFYGVGNHGGGPTRRQIAAIREIERDRLPGRLAFSSPDAAFDAIRAQKPRLPVWSTELQHHASGCYSVASTVKKSLREAEQTLLAAEKWCAVADALDLAPYPAPKLAAAWENVLFNEFHDILCGCSAKIGLDEAVEMFHESRAAAAKLLHKTLGRLCKQIDTMLDGATNAGKTDWQLWEENDNGIPVVVFNPHSWTYEGHLTINARVRRVCAPDGDEAPLQYVYGDTVNGADLYDTLFPVSVPPMGYAVYWAYKTGTGKDLLTLCAPRDELALENERLRVHFDPQTGHMISLFDKQSGAELLSGPAGAPVILDDSAYDTWAHGQTVFRKELARLTCDSIRFLETGELSETIRVRYTYGASTLQLDYVLRAGAPAVELRVKSIWQAPHTIVKLAFPLALRDCAAFAEIPYGRIERPANGEEEPMLSWCDLTGTGADGASYGLAVANDGRYSYDALHSELRVTVLRNCIYGDHFAAARPIEYDFTDEGLRYATFLLCPHAGAPDGRVSRLAAELNSRPVYVIDTYHNGTLGRTASFAAVDCDHVQLSAVKGAEDGDGYVLRLWETANRPAVCTLSFPLFGRSLPLELGASEVRTLRVTRDGRLRVTDFLEY